MREVIGGFLDLVRTEHYLLSGAFTKEHVAVAAIKNLHPAPLKIRDIHYLKVRLWIGLIEADHTCFVQGLNASFRAILSEVNLDQAPEKLRVLDVLLADLEAHFMMAIDEVAAHYSLLCRFIQNFMLCLRSNEILESQQVYLRVLSTLQNDPRL